MSCRAQSAQGQPQWLICMSCTPGVSAGSLLTKMCLGMGMLWSCSNTHITPAECQVKTR